MKTLKFASVVLLSTLILTGCGSGSESGDSTAPAAPAPTLNVHGVEVQMDRFDSSVIFTQDFDHRPNGLYNTKDLKDDFGCDEIDGNLYNMNACNDATSNLHGFHIKDGEIVVTFKEGTIGSGVQFTKSLGFNYDELFLTFQVRFDQDYDQLAQGGKLMGVGGDTTNTGIPTGCMDVGPNEGFTTRYEYRSSGSLAHNIYHQDKPGVCGDEKYIVDMSEFNNRFKFNKDQTYTIEMRIKMNTPFVADGEYETFINGHSMRTDNGFIFSEDGSIGINRFLFQLYIGGNTASWELSNPSTMYLDNFVLSTERIVEVIR